MSPEARTAREGLRQLARQAVRDAVKLQYVDPSGAKAAAENGILIGQLLLFGTDEKCVDIYMELRPFFTRAVPS